MAFAKSSTDFTYIPQVQLFWMLLWLKFLRVTNIAIKEGWKILSLLSWPAFIVQQSEESYVSWRLSHVSQWSRRVGQDVLGDRWRGCTYCTNNLSLFISSGCTFRCTLNAKEWTFDAQFICTHWRRDPCIFFLLSSKLSFR